MAVASVWWWVAGDIWPAVMVLNACKRFYAGFETAQELLYISSFQDWRSVGCTNFDHVRDDINHDMDCIPTGSIVSMIQTISKNIFGKSGS